MSETKKAASGVAAPETAGERKEMQDPFPVTSYHGGASPSSGIGAVAALLRRGERNALPTREVAAALGVPVRTVRRMVAAERRSGALILSSRKNGGGLFLPSDDATQAAGEISRFICVMTSQCAAQFEVLAAARRALLVLPDQAKIGEVIEE